MNVIPNFLKNTFFKGRQKLSGLSADTKPINMTRALLNPEKILIFPYTHMGTVLLSTRVFKALRDHFPHAKISVAVNHAWSVLIQRDPTIDEVITFGDFIETPNSKEFKDFGKLLKEKEFDLAFFLSYHFDEEIAYLIRYSNAKLRISFSGNEELEYFNVGIVPSAGDRYEVERYLELLRTLGINGNVRDYTMTVTESIQEKARQRYLPSGTVPRSGRVIGFDLSREIIGSAVSKKHAETIIKTFVTQLKSTVIVFYEPNKKAMAAEMKELFGKDIILVEDRPVSMLAGMMSLCRFIIAFNSDLLQLSTALKIPTIGVLTKQDAIVWTVGENDNFVHLACQAGSCPPANAFLSSAKAIIAKTKSKK